MENLCTIAQMVVDHLAGQVATPFAVEQIDAVQPRLGLGPMAQPGLEALALGATGQRGLGKVRLGSQLDLGGGDRELPPAFRPPSRLRSSGQRGRLFGDRDARVDPLRSIDER